ncbi:MAG: aminoacyl-histidine dipeptidase [Lachnospiraceae bacterium]|nr:aminoacyl-histidine dipeptidase [Lachnospiraceae bacterium]
MAKLSGLEPKKVFEFFEYINSVPRGSGNTSAVSELCMKFAKERSLTAFKDKLNNVIIYKPATPGYENKPAVIIQGHLDMVCAKTAECTKDMATEAIDLNHDDKYVFADGTTLGGDDGIAIAYALALLDSDDVKHPALECVFTIDEEIGMDGATGINPALISGRKLLNIDSEVEGVFTCGCAGGCRLDSEIPVNFETKNGVLLDIEISGLKGGHSGLEIDKQPASANYQIGRILRELYNRFEFNLYDISGGKFDNVICERANATILIDKKDIDTAKEFLANYDKILKIEYSSVNPDVILKTSVKDTFSENVKALDNDSTLKVLNAITLSYQGVIEMSMELKGMVQTSQNIGVIKLVDNLFKMGFLVRSSIESQKESALNKIKILIELLGGKIKLFGNYPGWKFERDSTLRDICVQAYKDSYGKDPIVDTIHAGLECGIFIDKLKGLDAISFGPNILDIHTPNERLDIASVERVWKMLLMILERC